MIETIITTFHILVALFMIVVVLIQGGNSGGMGAALGGSNSGGVFGAAGANKALTNATYFCAMAFMVTSISLTVLSKQSVGLADQIKQAPAAVEEKPSSSMLAPTNNPDEAQEKAQGEASEKKPTNP